MTKYAVELFVVGEWAKLYPLHDSMTEAELVAIRFDGFQTRVVPVEVSEGDSHR